MRKVLLLLVMCSAIASVAQDTQVRIRAVNENREPLASALITVRTIPDSVLVQEMLSDTTGSAVFRLQVNTPYMVQISSMNHTPVEKSITIKEQEQVFTFVAETRSRSLTGVVVTANRPLMRQEDDKTIIDPENLALSSTNSFEILEKTPGLFVDQDGNVYLSSTTPARIYINGREQRMSAADMATVLKSLPPNAIASIEVLRTPSARYDASGSGGVVNIILRKGVRIGLTGSLNAGMSQGKYGNQFLSFMMNNNTGKLSQTINLQYTRRNSFDEMQSTRFFTLDSMLTQNAFTRYPGSSFYAGYSIGYQFTDKWDVNYDSRFTTNQSNSNTRNASALYRINSSSTGISSHAGIVNDVNSYNINQAVNLKYKIDDVGSEWSTDVSFVINRSANDQHFSTEFVRPFAGVSTGAGDIHNRNQFFTAQTNLVKKLAGRLTFETGLKSSLLSFDNNTAYFRTTGGNREKDHLRTAAYDYQEHINAGYVQASRSFNAFVLKAGTRVENTNMRGHQMVPRDTSFSLNRTDLFPYVYLSRNLMKIAGFDLRAYLVYRRTINRPAYENLNPAQRYVDPYLFETGNPSLRPQFTNNYEANISVNERPIFAVGINEQTDIFTQVLYQADSTRSVAYRTYDNLGKNKETYFRAMGAIPPGGKYFFVLGAQYNHNNYQGLYEMKPINFTRGSWSLFTYHNLKVTPTTQFTLNGYVRLNGQLQFYELGTFGQLNASLNQQLMKRKLTISLNVSDIFYTSRNDFEIQQGNFRATGSRQFDSRRLGLNFRYNFGIRKKEEVKIPDVDTIVN